MSEDLAERISKAQDRESVLKMIALVKEIMDAAEIGMQDNELSDKVMRQFLDMSTTDIQLLGEVVAGATISAANDAGTLIDHRNLAVLWTIGLLMGISWERRYSNE